jgi:hypothetical protein
MMKDVIEMMVPEHRKYSIVGFPLIDGEPVPAVIDFAGSYEEAEKKAAWAKENHIHGANYRTHAGRKIATGKIEIRKTRPGKA